MSDQWRIGELQLDKVEEQIWEVSPRWLFANADYDTMRGYANILAPHYVTEAFKLKLSIHSFVLRTERHTILVDTCVGNHKERHIDTWNQMDTPYLERLGAVGVKPEDVDYVFCTHLHVDHVGWNTRLEDGRWVPTFPNARYLYNRAEYDHWSNSDDRYQAPVMADSVEPIVAARQVDFVDEGHQIDDGVCVVATPGHTPGHCSVMLGDREGVITGDMVHHPVQLHDPTIYSHADSDGQQAVATRLEHFARWASDGTRLFGTHFATPTALHIETSSNGYRFLAD
ncbi:MAG: MBL fold metallo-hydrolase [Pseudomonadota bacterium]